ncbi:MAG: hypothetical protein RLZZ578_420 [Bacteroidota bacterium]
MFSDFIAKHEGIQVRNLLLIVFSILLLMGFRASIPDYFPQPHHPLPDARNDSMLIYLGKQLFHDPILSRDNSISCASCHSQYNAFAHSDHPLSHGINDRIGKRNAPALMNLAWLDEFMWDGGSFSLEAQTLVPLTTDHEMDNDPNIIVAKLQQHSKYPEYFLRTFGDTKITIARILRAIATFERTLISKNAKYDSVMQGIATFSDQESRGYALFKQHCNTCHTEPLFTNGSFANNGLPIDTVLNDVGRFAITHDSSDIRHFKVPTLRNLLYSFPYMHDGRFKRLRDVIKHYTQLIDFNDSFRDIPRPLLLNEREQTEILSFLHTLTDKTYIFNPEFSNYQAKK